MQIRKIPVYIWILIAIVAVGIFLRTYNFHDWLRFSMDQSRDALIVGKAVNGEESLPLLGPLAGGTFFHLGPAYYQFSFLSAKIFGNYPDRMAYPSLFFSILAMPLLFVFLREYFSKNISLIVTAVMSVSYFFIENSRFSSNPNLIPFFILLFLYALLRIANKSEKNIWWAILAGVALGVGIQLHTTLLVIMPIFTVMVFAYLAKKMGVSQLKYLLAIMAVSLVVNTSQIINEFRTDWSNTKNFFDGMDKKGGGESLTIKNAMTVPACQAKSGISMVFSFPVVKECSKMIDMSLKSGSKEVYPEIKDKMSRRTLYALNISILFVFYIFGHVLLILKFLREKDRRKRIFLGMVGLFDAIALFFLIPVVSSISVNYFIIIFFVPLVMLGLILEFFHARSSNYGIIITVVVVSVFVGSAMVATLDATHLHEKRLNNNLENSDLKWAEEVSEFLVRNLGHSEVAYLSGEKKYLARYAGPIGYMIYQQGAEAVEVDASQIDEVIPENQEFIYIKNEGDELAKAIHGYRAIASEHFSPIDIYILKK